MPALKPYNYVPRTIDPRSVRVLHDVIVGRVLYEKKHQGEIYIPKVARERSQLLRVLAVGEDYRGPVRPGDIVFYDHWKGKEWQSIDEDIVAVKPDDVFFRVDLHEGDDE